MSYIIGLLGGLTLFLFGMENMSTGLESTAGNKLQIIIEKFTKNKFIGLLMGILITALVQSSSAVTVMTIGFVNTGIMTLPQAITVIMGANIGTTITGQIVALNITDYAPLMAFIGFVMFTFVKKERIKYIGQTIMGLGLLFMGLEFMSESMAPLRENEAFVSLLTQFKNPILGILAGTFLTVIIQSSSASLGILQALAGQNLISVASSMFIIFGFNIGTCITSVLSTINSNKNAKRTAASHVLFNVTGTVIFLILVQFIDISDLIIKFSPSKTPQAILANIHTLFNIATTVFLFPFASLIAKMATFIIRGEDKKVQEMALQYINRNFEDPRLVISSVKQEIERMFLISKTNFKLALDIFNNSYDEEKYENIMENEDTINFLNKEITSYITKILDSSYANWYTGNLAVIRSIERIGDHTKSIADLAKYSHENNLEYTVESKREISALETTVMTMFQTVLTKMTTKEKHKRIKYYDNKVERYIENYRIYHIERMKNKVCDPESGLMFEKLLTAMARISSYINSITKFKLD